jgi:serine phosphatase RsbU (regulator of sigma subunit)
MDIPMKEAANPLDIVRTVLELLEHRQTGSPGVFESLNPLFRELEYESAAIYIADDYPDRMTLASGYGGENRFPRHILRNRRKSLYDEALAGIGPVPGLMAGPLFSHGRELGVLAVTSRDSNSRKVREAFDMLSRTVSIMACMERVRTNSQRERQEREVFFAQSLTNRLLVRPVPLLEELRLGFEFARSLDAGGDFFDFIPMPDGNLLGYIGSCSGRGLRTVLEVASIMREINYACVGLTDVSHALKRANYLLVKEMHRAHQASLALFHIDIHSRKLRIAKSGRLGLLICGSGGDIRNISAPGSLFLGMVDNPDFREETYDFLPGQALFCVTEGFYSPGVLDDHPQIQWFLDVIAGVVAKKRGLPLANAVFDDVNRRLDRANHPDESMLAVSVEFTALGDSPLLPRDTVRLRRDSVRIRSSERLRR